MDVHAPRQAPAVDGNAERSVLDVGRWWLGCVKHQHRGDRCDVPRIPATRYIKQTAAGYCQEQTYEVMQL